eukprot:9318283-Alexandrium_andersonii.AAC.1
MPPDSAHNASGFSATRSLRSRTPGLVLRSRRIRRAMPPVPGLGGRFTTGFSTMPPDSVHNASGFRAQREASNKGPRA